MRRFSLPPAVFRVVSLAVAVVVLVALAGCGISRSKAEASRGMDRFHAQYNESEFERIYDTADPVFKKTMGRGDFLKFIDAVHRKLGSFKSCESKSWQTHQGDDGVQVTLLYKSTFEKGMGEETFVYLVSGARATLQGYQINSHTFVSE